MATFLSIAKIFRPLKSTEHIYEVILINTEPRHVKSGADLHGKENVILVDFFFYGLFRDFSSKTSQMYMNGVFFIIMASPNRILNLSQLNTSIPLLLMLTTSGVYTTLNHGLPENHLFNNSERFP